MTATLVGERLQTLSSVFYDRKVAQFRGSNGRFVPRSTILKLVDEEAARLSTRMKAHARLMTDGKIGVDEFQRRAAEDLKLSCLRMGVFASGGRSQTSNQVYGVVGRGLRDQYNYLQGFSQDLAAGNLTKEQAINRAGMYGGSARTAFHQSEKITRKREGFKLAKRVLDAGARHCDECLSYATPDFVSIDKIVPVGSRCSCASRCRCRITFLK